MAVPAAVEVEMLGEIAVPEDIEREYIEILDTDDVTLADEPVPLDPTIIVEFEI